MKITNNQQAPDFKVTDVYNKPVSISQFKGKKILLTFFRNAGCPVCNLRFHSLEQQSAFFKANNVVFIAVYASEQENMLHYLRSSYADSTMLYPIFIANPDQSLYKLYETERSTGKLITSLLFHSGFSNVNKGKKLFKDKIKDDSPTNMINADFLIDETGKVVNALEILH
jgi:thioredoxin-dependent peroxiredoxin